MLGTRSILCVALCCLGGMPLRGQIPQDLQQAMRTRDQAVAQADAATWDRLTTDDFIVVGPDGKLMTKPERLVGIRQQKPRTPSPHLQEEVRVYGDAAVQRFQDSDSVWVIILWVKQARGWRAAAAQIGPAVAK